VVGRGSGKIDRDLHVRRFPRILGGFGGAAA
jgi:hypothetical protein